MNQGVIVMVKVIMGLKGTGKTKQMIDLINTAVDTEHGNVVAIAHDSKQIGRASCRERV